MAAAAAAAPGGEAQPREFSRSELQTMLGQCLKLASENKITPHNTWGLPLIEHLPDLIKEERSGDGTNFQRASVTLDAGVKIYSYRVDSVHTETYKMLGGLGRASGPTADDGDGGDDESEEGDVDASHGEGGTQGGRRRRQGQELNPEATLEASLEALNVKKFDLAFAVDPLFHKTSAQFDEGGAKGAQGAACVPAYRADCSQHGQQQMGRRCRPEQGGALPQHLSAAPCCPAQACC